jgi:enoyl-CoA hydratase
MTNCPPDPKRVRRAAFRPIDVERTPMTKPDPGTAHDHLLRSTPQPGVALLTLNRPDRLNALSWELIEDLLSTCAQLAQDPEVRVVVLTGAGRGFCAGLDLSATDPLGRGDSSVTVYERQELVGRLPQALRELPQPVIAAVNGPAAGGGLGLALAADVRLCSPTAIFSVAFVRLGLSGCDAGVSHTLPRLVGEGIAAEWMLTGRRVAAAEAAGTGLVNRIVDGDLLAAAVDLAGEIVVNSPFGVRMTKQVLHRNVDATSLAAAVELENRTQVLAVGTEDSGEAVDAFLAKRPPVFHDR